LGYEKGKAEGNDGEVRGGGTAGSIELAKGKETCGPQHDGLDAHYVVFCTTAIIIIIIYYYCIIRGGAMVQQIEHWTCDQQVVGSNPTQGKSCEKTLSKLFTPMCLCHQAA